MSGHEPKTAGASGGQAVAEVNEALVEVDGRSREVFFLTGHGKSGTNWIGNLLNLHPSVLCKGEWGFQRFFDIYDWFTKRGPNVMGADERVRTIMIGSLREMVRQSIATIVDERPEATLLGDRSPLQVRDMLPGAKCIYALRDGRDVLVSYTFHRLRINNDRSMPAPLQPVFRAFVAKHGADPDGISAENPGLLGDEQWVRRVVRMWRDRVRQDLAAGKKLGEERFYIARYESIHADQAEEVARMFRFLGLDPDAADEPSKESKTLPGFGREDRGSFFRKGAVGDWHIYATPEADRWIEEEAGELLAELGYRSEAPSSNG